MASSRTALVLYGSETGNAQDVAEEIGKLLQRLRFKVRVAEMNTVQLHELSQSQIVLFSVSTTGQGDFPGNAHTFWKRLLPRRLGSDALEDVHFTSFGLGDTSYPKYNFAQRKLNKRLIQLGAQSFYEAGEADEQHEEGLEGTLIPWLARLRQTLLQLYPLEPGQQPVPDDIFLTPDWELKLDEDDTSNHQAALENNGYSNTSTTPAVSVVDHEKNGASGPIDSTSASSDHNHSILGPGTFEATVTRNQRLTPEDHWQDVRLFGFSTLPIDYHPGDVLTIFPHNASSSVDKLIELMQWQPIADKPVHFAPSDPNSTPSSPPPQLSLSKTTLTLRHLLTTHLDLNAIPRRSFFANLSHFTTDEFQHNRLIEFTAPEYVDELFDYTTRPRRSIIEVLDEFDTVKIPWKWITSILPSIRGRQYSIASGGELKTSENGTKGSIDLLIAMVKYRTVIKKIREGLCSRYMSGLEVGQKLNVLLCKGGMRIAMDKPAVMIGPGTGVAPLRSMMFELAMAQGAGEGDEREAQRQKQLLFYGGRNQAKDFFFENDWSQLSQKLDLDVFTAWSRDQSSKVYVQDIIRQQASLVFQTLQIGNIYICGSSGKMPIAVRAALVDVFAEQGKMSMEQAEERLAKMEKEGRYQQETW